MFFSSKLKEFKNIKHCFFSRKNGFSEGLYKSLNCGTGSGDKKENVLKNLEYVSNKIGCKKENLITLNQKHSNQVIFFDKENSVDNKLTGDAIISKVKNIGISILTADCAPILFYDPNNKIIGCVHSGWKGALNGIIKNTVKKFNELNSKSSDLIAVVGPCIKKENYEVKIDFFEKFVEKDKKNKEYFERINKEKYIFDLRGFINKEINSLNIKKVENIERDTFSESEFFYSYRRSCFNKKKDYGRCISVILMT
ncbi:peptidoglycan editing factor PgeF [Pelagibacteraceae bacterium]|nr:peptidoglycan editing factor PgeF [Pelagibacteraceae bacterium]